MIAWWLIAAPAFLWRGEGHVDAAPAYSALERTYTQVTGAPPPATAQTIVIEPDGLTRGHAGSATLGRIRLRVNEPFALEHEVAHQFLLAVCPQASADKLFHEGFAVATSGELDAWIDEGYFPATKAMATLAAGQIDTQDGRRALARLLGDGVRRGKVPVAIERRLKQCASGQRWIAMAPAELSTPTEPLRTDAFIALSRHSGEVLVKEGDVEAAMPFGSTLKPFVAGGNDAAPELTVNGADPLWRCGEQLPRTMTVNEALARSCNGYFLAWGKTFGAFGPLLSALGLARLPETPDEAIGLRPTLALSPWAIAQAYRVLAEARPELIRALEATPHHGTLSGLGLALDGVGVKSGTVRDPENNVQLGWLVAVSADHVAVMVKKGKMPRAFAEELAARVSVLGHRELEGKASVQTFALLDGHDVQLSCDGVFVSLVARTITLHPLTFRALATVLKGKGDRVLCVGRPFIARFTGMAGRAYAGTFARDPVVEPELAKPRRGSDFVFSTTEARYVAGVLQAEDATIGGEAARALAKVILHNAHAAHSRHGGRPVCDTTHCQAFLGTPKEPAPKNVARVASWLDGRGWLPFSKGGDEPWQQERAVAEVNKAIGVMPVSLQFQPGVVRVRSLDSSTMVEVDDVIPCERLRGPLKLPSCPTAAAVMQERVRFSGVGAGHGEGLDVEAAKGSGDDAEAILKRAYR